MATKRKQEGFCFASMKKGRPSEEQMMVQRLNQIQHSLFNFPIVTVTQDIASFNHEYYPKSKMMGEAKECAHLEVISLLMRLLRNTEQVKDPEQQQFRTESYFLLGLLARNDLGGQTVEQEGGFSLLISHLKMFKDDVTTVCSCCFALGNILSCNHVNVGEASGLVRSEALLPFIFHHLTEHIENEQLAQKVFFLLGNIAFISDFELDMLENGAPELATRVLRQHPSRVDVATDVVFFLKNLAFGEKGRLEIIRCDPIVQVLNALANNIENVELVEITLNFFFNLSFSGAIAILTKTSQPICLFITLIKYHRYNALPLNECLRTMIRIYLHSSASVRVAIVQEGFIDCLMQLYALYQPFLIQNEEHGDQEKNANAWKKDHPSLLHTNGETNLELFFQIETAFKKIVLLPLPTYEYVPSGPPSLHELAIRAIKRHAASQVLEISPQDDPSIPEDLRAQLSSCKKCDFCHNHYYSYEYNVIFPGSFLPLAFLVPVYWRLCSGQCLAAVKAKKSLPDL